MASAYGDVLLDFDLDFLQQTTNGSVVPTKTDKFKKQLLVAKKRTIAVDALIRKYYEKKEEKDLTEKSLLDSKEECKQACIKYSNAIQKLSQLEEENEKLQTSYKELQESYSSCENRCHAIQSHANQLQLLVKENETKLDALQVENQLEQSSLKDCEKKISALKKELSTFEKKVDVLGNEKLTLNEHISILCEVAVGKKKINKDVKLLLTKYLGNSDDIVIIEEDNDIESTEPAVPVSTKTENLKCTEEKAESVPVCPETMQEHIKVCSSKDKHDLINDICDRDSECSNGVISSEDTGRGSSLTYSDSEKCMQSPDYFSHDSPLNMDPIKRYPKVELETAHKATSPIIFQEESSFIPVQKVTTPVKKHTEFKDTATSPIMINCELIFESELVYDRTELVEIPDIIIQENDTTISPVTDMVDKSINNENVQTENYHENNDSNILCINENSEDYEVATILNTMSLHKKLITPLPPSPIPTSQTDTSEINIESSDNSEFKMLFQHIAKLMKDVNDIKSNVPKLNDIKKIVNEVCDEREKIKDSIHPHDTENKVNLESSDKPNNHNIFGEEDNDSMVSNDDLITPEDLLSVQDTLIESCDDFNNCNKSDNNRNVSVTDRLLFEDSLLSDKEEQSHEDTLNSSQVVPEVTQNCDINLEIESNNNRVRRPYRKGKVSKLEKLRKGFHKVKSVCKIKPADVPVTKLRDKKKKLPSQTKANEANHCVKTAKLNNKTAYEKALVIVADIRAKQKNKIEKLTNKEFKRSKRPNHDNVLGPKSNIVTSVIETESNVEDFTSISHENEPKVTEKNTIEEDIFEINTEHNECQFKEIITPPMIETIQTISTCSSEISESSSSVATRSQTKTEENVTPESLPTTVSPKLIVDKSSENCDNINIQQNNNNVTPEKGLTKKQSLKRAFVDKHCDVQPKRVLRSSSVKMTEIESVTAPPIENNVPTNATDENCKVQKDYSDLQMFMDVNTPSNNKVPKLDIVHPRNSVLCKMIKKHGCFKNSRAVKKIPDIYTDRIHTKLEEEISKISSLQGEELKLAMNKLVVEILYWNYKHFLSGFMKYLRDPERKVELFSKVCVPPSPPMTKAEEILLYVLTQLQTNKQQGGWSTVVTDVLRNIEYTIFRLNNTPDFNTIESMSHFYAVLCRYTRAKNKLRIFMLDAMYCIAFKSIPLIKQCIDVWSHVLPLANLRIGKSPLVLCIVYLLHFYKCDDSMNRIQELRIILQRRYSFNMGEWNETEILKMLRKALLELRDIPMEKKMLRLALILIAKRHGTIWSHKNIVKNMLLSLIEKNDLPDMRKQFCLSVLGPILKPFPNDMKVHCEIVMNQLIDMLDQNRTHETEEAVVTSLVFMSKHNSYRVNKALLTWRPQKEISPDLEELLRDYVRDKPIKIWKRDLSKIQLKQ